MIFANDKFGNKISADSGVKYKECYCRVCGEPVRHRVGTHNIPHFAHLPDSECAYGKDKDNKSEWHRRMQGLFPEETNEVIFVDKNTGEKHIADVFLKDYGTIIEFQHSPISPEEFKKRTDFHLAEDRRIIWVFDETTENGNMFCRLKQHTLNNPFVFVWPRSPRKMLTYGPSLYVGNNCSTYSVFVYCGDGENTVHRIIAQEDDFKYVRLSVHQYELKADMDCNEFFYPEEDWLIPGNRDKRLMESFLSSPYAKQLGFTKENLAAPKKVYVREKKYVKRKPRL